MIQADRDVYSGAAIPVLTCRSLFDSTLPRSNLGLADPG
jgi:hypothetical protein